MYECNTHKSVSGQSTLVKQSFNSKYFNGANDIPLLITFCKAAPARTGFAQPASESGSAGVHFLLTAVPEGQQSVVFVDTEVAEVSEEAIGQLLVPEHARPPGFGQHSVVGPVVTNALVPPKRTLAVRSGGVPASALLPA